MNDIKKILILRFDTMGDMILFSGVLDALIAEFPGAEITMMVLEKMRHTSAIMNPRIKWWPVPAEIHRNSIESIYTGDLDYQRLSRLVSEINRVKFDLLVNPLYSQTFLGSVITRLSTIRERIGFSSDDGLDISRVPSALRGALQRTTYTRTIRGDEWSGEIEKNQQILEAVLQKELPFPHPRLYVKNQAFEWADRYLADIMPLKSGRFAVLFPGAGLRLRLWPLKRFAALARWLFQDIKIIPVFVGSDNDKQSLDEIRVLSRRMTGREPIIAEFAVSELDRFAALLSRASLFIGNDTGPMHAAAALGVPVIGIFGGGTWGRFHPYGDRCIVVSHAMSCFQCTWNCLDRQYRCVKIIKEKTVRHAVKTILDNSGDWSFGQPKFINNREHMSPLGRWAFAISEQMYYGRPASFIRGGKMTVKKVLRRLHLRR